MLKIVIVVLLAVNAFALLPNTGLRRIRPGPVIQTTVGLIQGQHETVDIFRSHLSFKGIPYAQPPVGNLRFSSPLPAHPWQGIKRAFDHGASCPQFPVALESIIGVVGEEDCLFLNVYTPTNIRSRLPVMVDIHGGAFVAGSGDTSAFGPELLLQEDVIYVSFNYRLGVFGFLNTGDHHSPGNNGLKDMILALRWVQNNIAFFGGNPEDVTIMGVSAGGAAVHALILSQQSQGLFHKALSHSGSLFNTYAFQSNPQNSINMLVRNLQINPTSPEDLISQLRQVSMERMMSAAGNDMAQNPPLFLVQYPFVPTVDAVGSLEPRILTGTPVQMLRGGLINRIPYLLGFNSVESLNSIAHIRDDPTILERFNQNPNLLIPREWNIEPNTQTASQMITAIRNTYFGGRLTVTPDMEWEWSNFVSDREFILGVSRAANWHVNFQPTYYFKFSYSGSLNLLKIALRLGEFPGALHGEDIMYLNRLNRGAVPALPGDHAFTVSRMMVRLWSNFAKYGNPTPTSFDPLLHNTIWPLMTVNNEFLDIGSFLQNQLHPMRERLDMWQMLINQFNIEQ